MSTPTPQPTPQQLAQDHVEYAKALAAKVRRRVRLPRYVDQQELEGWALLGLSESAQRFDATRGAMFSSFAYRRIVGAVYNGIGKMHDAPAAARRRARQMSRMQEALPATNTDRHAPADALAAAIDRVGATVTVQRLESWSEPAVMQDPADELMDVESADRLHAAIERLPEAMREVVRLYHLSDLTMAEVARRLKTSAPTVCRRNREALAQLAVELQRPVTVNAAAGAGVLVGA